MESDFEALVFDHIGEISIHAPRVESDMDMDGAYLARRLFQSTLPVWRATSGFLLCGGVFVISIHAPRVESDKAVNARWNKEKAISIHAPRVESDPLPGTLTAFSPGFQSTLPVWRATYVLLIY